MKVLFKNTTKYTKENCNNFIKFHNNKFGRKELFKIIICVLAIMYIVIFNTINKNWILILSIIIIGILFYIFGEKSKKKDKNKGKEFTFYFYEKYIKIKYRRSFERLKYFHLHKIFETDKYFFLYLDEKNSLILNKDGFEVGTPKGFSIFIKAKCPFKYKDEKK